MLDTKAIIMTEPGRADLRDISVPVAASETVLLRVELCGVCTPEQRVFRGASQTYPYWGGHELSAVVEEDKTPNVLRPLEPGTRVALGLMPRCGHCDVCRRGLDNHCAYVNRAVLPVKSEDFRGPGGFTTRIAVERYKVFVYPDDVPTETVALTEPVACCLRSIKAGDVRPGATVAVFGAGTMGRIHAALLKNIGCRVLVFDNDEAARDAVAAHGADHVGEMAGGYVAEVVSDLTKGEGVAAAFCTRGGSQAVDSAIEVSRRGGSVVLYQSLPRDKTLSVDLNYLHYQEIKLIGTIAQSANDLAEARDLLSANPAFYEKLALRTVDAQQPETALNAALEPGINRALVDFRGL